MSFEPNLLNLFLILSGLMIGAALLLILGALKIQETKIKTELNKKFAKDTTAIQKELTDLKALDALQQKRNFERSLNVAEIKIREQILGYTKWEKTLGSAKVFLSAATTAAVVGLLLAIKSVYRIDFQAEEDAVAGLVGVFILSYIFWAYRVENYWRKAKINDIKTQYMTILQYAANPVDAREKFVTWIRAQPEISEVLRKSLETMFEAWLKESLLMA